MVPNPLLQYCNNFHPYIPLPPLDFLGSRIFQLWLTSKFYHHLTLTAFGFRGL
jgi:hypothetical protein